MDKHFIRALLVTLFLPFLSIAQIDTLSLSFNEVFIENDDGLQSWENINFFQQDKEGVFWCAINEGVFRYNGHSALNVSAYLSTKYGLELEKQTTTRVLKKEKILWVGRRKGLLKVDLRTQRKKEIFLDSALQPANYRNSIRRLVSKNDTLYVGTGNGLYLVDEKKVEVLKKYLTHGVAWNHTASSNGVESIYLNVEPGAFWVVLNSGLYRIDKKTDNVEKYSFKEPSLKYKHHFSDGDFYDDEFLFSSWGLGMVKFNIKTKKFKIIPYTFQENFKIWDSENWDNNIVRSVIKINDSLSLVNFARFGNAYFNRVKETYTFLNSPEELKQGVFLCEDRSGYVWAGKIGRLWRTTEPITALKKPFHHNLDITGFKANNLLKSMPAIEGYDTIELNEERNVSVEYALTKAYILDTVLYEFKLNDKTWQSSRQPNNIELKDLSGSLHKLSIRALDQNKKVLAEKSLSFRINIPFYKTPLFYGMMVVLFIGAGFMISQFIQSKRMSRKLKELDSAKSNFFANISHELRTPLALIATPLQEKLSNKQLTAEDRRLYELMLRNNQQLTHLVDQLLDLSKLESRNLSLHVSKTQVVPLLKSIVEPFEYQAKRDEYTFVFNLSSQEEKVWVDRDALQKITSNLLSNALKYTTEKGSIIVDASVSSKNLKFSVSNTGNPLTEDQKKKLFNRFYQADVFKQGAGIGLALAKELVELHKGRITVENKAGFVVFQVILPCHKSNFKSSELYKGATIAITNTDRVDIQVTTPIIEDKALEKEEFLPLLLIVEDNPDLRTVLQETFNKEYQITLATNGEEGVAKAISLVPDLILSDVMMPKKDGVELTQLIKDHELTSHIPIVLLTAKAGDENELAGISNGADDYITKPFNTTLLRSKMANLLTNRQKMRERYSQEIILKPKDIAVTSLDELLLERIQSVLDTFLLEPSFSTADFAKELGYSRMQLHRKLKALTGLSASEFIRSQRLKIAAQILQESGSTVSESCYQSGFNNLSYFTKCFKEAYGTTPSDYLKKS